MSIHASHDQLIRDIDQTRLADGQLAFWWLAQHSFILKIAGRILYIDPFLTNLPGRQVPPLLTAQEIQHADLFLATHDHADHLDRPAWPTLAQASPDTPFIVPELLRRRLSAELDIPAERLLGIDDGQTIERDGLRITAVAAAHEFLDRDDKTGRYPYLGYVIEADGLVVYHAGDTCIYEGLVSRLRKWRFDLMLLPINGRDAKRLQANIVGNMTYQEAVDLAGTLNTRYVVPTHYDMFKENPGDPQAFVDYLAVKFPNVQSIVPDYGRAVILHRPDLATPAP